MKSDARIPKGHSASKAAPLRLDVGCGFNRKEGFRGLDSNPKCKPDVKWDMTKIPYPIKAGSVEVLHCSHALENAINSRNDLIKVIQEWYRISKPNSKWIVTLPHWTRFSTIEHLIGFGPDWINNFSKDFEYSPDHYDNLDLAVDGIRYNWRKAEHFKGLGKFLNVIKFFWNPVIIIGINNASAKGHVF